MSEPAGLIAEMRRFNRFYTRTIGVLEETLTASPFTLTEARVLFELGHRARPAAPDIPGERGFLAKAFHLNIGPAASEIASELRLDPAYLTRILGKFAAGGLTEVRADEADRRRRILSLTAKGRGRAGRPAGGGRPRRRAPDRTDRTAGAPTARRGDAGDRGDAGFRSTSCPKNRRPRSSSGRIASATSAGSIERQSRLYAEEYGWNGEYEALVAEIGAAFIRNFQPGKEFCWIAEMDGVRCRRRLSRAQIRRGGTIAPAACRAGRARFRHRQDAGVAMRRNCKAGRLSQARAVDQRRAGRRPPPLRARRLHAGRAGTSPQFRQGSGRPDLGVGPVAPKRDWRKPWPANLPGEDAIDVRQHGMGTSSAAG